MLGKRNGIKGPLTCSIHSKLIKDSLDICKKCITRFIKLKLGDLCNSCEEKENSKEERQFFFYDLF